MTRMTSDRYAPGARIGDYVVEHEVAYEASAIVYLATHVMLPRQARIKVTHPGSRAAAIQLLREACILEALSHPGVPRVYECGVLADRRPWSAIEVMAGATLKELASDGPLTPADLLVMLRDVADILHHAHERGIAHRRLTPGAIVRLPRRHTGHAISDWSDARMLGAEVDGDVDPQGPIDLRDDIHALGALAFRALTGVVPEPVEAVEGTLSAGLYASSAPAELIALIDQMLAEPRKRPAASEVHE